MSWDWNVVINGVLIITGSIIGGAGSILGSRWATNRNIELIRKEAETNRQKSQLLSAGIIYNDLTGLLREMVYLHKNKNNLGFGSHNRSYSDHLAILENVLTPDEQYTVHRLYGILMKYQNIVNTNTSNLGELAQYEMHLSKILEFFVTTLYGDKATFDRYTATESLNGLDIKTAVDGMAPDFKNVFEKLEALKRASA